MDRIAGSGIKWDEFVAILQKVVLGDQYVGSGLKLSGRVEHAHLCLFEHRVGKPDSHGRRAVGGSMNDLAGQYGGFWDAFAVLAASSTRGSKQSHIQIFCIRKRIFSL